MDFHQIRAFLEVSRARHLTRAAERLHLSQPAVSGQIKALEEELGIPLFERTHAGMALTGAGRELLASAEAIVGAVQALRQTALELRGELTGTLRLGTLLDPAVLRVGELLARALARHPRLEIELKHVVTNRALQQVTDGTLDATYYFGQPPGALFAAIPLREIAYQVAMPVGWAPALADAGWEALARRPWVLTPDGSSHRQLVLELFRGRAEQPAGIVEADSEPVIRSLIEAGVGLSLVREEVLAKAKRDGRIAVWSGAEVKTKLWLACAAARQREPLLRSLFEMLREIWAPAEPTMPALRSVPSSMSVDPPGGADVGAAALRTGTRR